MGTAGLQLASCAGLKEVKLSPQAMMTVDVNKRVKFGMRDLLSQPPGQLGQRAACSW